MDAKMSGNFSGRGLLHDNDECQFSYIFSQHDHKVGLGIEIYKINSKEFRIWKRFLSFTKFVTYCRN